MDSLKQYVHKIRIPVPNEKIYKDECVFSFDTPDSPNGLYVCLNTFLGFGRNFVELHHKKTGNAVFLNLKRISHEIPQNDCEESKPKITKLAIGVEGGFDLNKPKYEYEDINSIVILPQFHVIPLPNTDIPDQVLQSISMVLSSDAAFKLEELQALAGTWDGTKRSVSKHAVNLEQLSNGIRIPPKGWKCEDCDKRDNLWLNLTDGSIRCGRKFFDGTGGNDHAMKHYETTKYPLAVKLGTITPDGADVFSYDENDMVEDPLLAKHLAHFGINITNMEKTEKSMNELEIDLNQRYDEWSIIQEEGSDLKPLYGPGFTGLANLGNSCYLNSVMQVIYSIPDFQNRYYPPNAIFESSPLDPPNDFTTQMAKLSYGLMSGVYSEEPKNGEPKEQTGIKPTMFKNLIGKGHHEFSTKRQQDAQEFFLHLIDVIERNDRWSVAPAPTDSFKFQVEERIECLQSKKVKYNLRTDFLIQLPVAKEYTNLEAVQAFEKMKKEMELKEQRIDPKDVVRPVVKMTTCIESFAAPTFIEDFYSSAINGKTTAKQIIRFKTFPDYLMVHMKKFEVGNDWVPKKLDISLDVPDIIDLEHLRGYGLQPGEELLPDSSHESENTFEFDSLVLAQLTEMGFPIDACKRALYNTNNGDIETTMNWIMEHMSDPNFSEPFTLKSSSTAAKAQDESFVADSASVATIMSMGFSQDQAYKALKATSNNMERAVDWIFSHSDELENNAMQMDVSAVSQPSHSASAPNCRDGSGKYRLVAFISHMGTSTMCGHYVCHILKGDRWAIFNDNKVALSESPPKDLAYMYLYKRL